MADLGNSVGEFDWEKMESPPEKKPIWKERELAMGDERSVVKFSGKSGITLLQCLAYSELAPTARA